MILDRFRINGKVAIVTGASRGIGKTLAIGLAEAGADIAGVARGDLTITQKEVEKLGRKFLKINADIGAVGSVETVLKKATSEFGSLDILVNNAGIIRRSPVVEFSDKDWDEVININLKAVFLLCREFSRILIKQGRGGKIINIASILSFQGGILVPSYTASKSAVVGLTRALANELACKNINVNAIAPGYIETDNTETLRKDVVRNEEIIKRIPAGRWGKPEDLVGAAVFLASDASSYMHGYTIAVD